MKIELIKIVNVYNVFVSLTKKRYSNWSTALKLANASKELESNRNFYLEKERDLLKSYVLKDKEGKLQFTELGQPKFESVEKAQEFNEELISLQKTKIDVFDPITISVNDFKSGEESLTPEEIMLLSDFITFTCEENGGKA